MADNQTSMRHTCAARGRSQCEPCVRFQVELWDAINRYAVSCGGDPGSHVYGNTPRMQAVVEVNQVVARSTHSLVDVDVAEASEGAPAPGPSWHAFMHGRTDATPLDGIDAHETLRADHEHLLRLYAESRDYVRALEHERDDLVAAANRGVAEQDRLDAEVEQLREQLRIAEAVRDDARAASASSLGARRALDAEVQRLRVERDHLLAQLASFRRGES